MGKSTKPNKWFKAVKKAFRSPSKERPPSPGNTKADACESLPIKHDFPPVTHQGPTPYPLPLFEIIGHEVGSERIRGQRLPTPAAVVDPTVSPVSPNTEVQKKEESEAGNDASNDILPVAETHQDDDDDSTASEEEEAATRIQNRFSSPLALKGLVRLQALVRGHLVRREAATTLRTIEAIVSVQAVFRGRLVRMSKDGRAVRSRISLARQHNSQNHAVVHGDKLEPLGPERVERKEANKRKFRPTAYLFREQLKRSTPNWSSSFIDCDAAQPHGGWAWLQLWTNARPWENHHQLEELKDYIEIIPSSRKNPQYTTKEVDVNTKVKYYEDYISDLNKKNTRFSSRPSLQKKELLCDYVDESDWQPTPRELSPVQVSNLPGSTTLTAHNHLTLSKPPPIQVPVTEEEDEEEEVAQKVRTPDDSAQTKPPDWEPHLVPLPPTVLEDASPDIIVPPSPQASDAASFSVTETPPRQLSDDHVPSTTEPERLVLTETHIETNGGEANGSSLIHSDTFSVSNCVHEQPGEDTPSPKGSASDEAVDGHRTTSNGHEENGDNKARKGELKAGESNGESPQVPSKRITCRYMAATESAKAKFRSSSSPKTRTTPDLCPESPPKSTPKRHSLGGTTATVLAPVSAKAADSSPKTAFGTRKSKSSSQNWRSSSPKLGGSKEKPRSVDTSPARRNSLGGVDGKRWRT